MSPTESPQTPPSKETKHVDELTLLRLADGELSEGREQTTREHLIACATCRASYEALKAESELVRAAVSEADEALPEHIRPRQQDFSWLVVAVLSLGTLGFSTIWSSIIAPTFESLKSLGLDGASIGSSLVGEAIALVGWSSLFLKLAQGLLLVAALLVGRAVTLRIWRRVRTSTTSLVAALAIGATLFVMTPAPASAAVVQLDVHTYTLEASETVDNDLIVAGGTIYIHGVVAGDLMVAAARVEVSGEVQGDIIGFAETITVTGIVRGSLRAVARHVIVDGSVGRNLSTGSETMELRESAVTHGSVLAGARAITLDGTVARDVILAAQTTVLTSSIDGGVLAVGEELRVGPNAAIGGDAHFRGRQEPDVDPASELASPFTFEAIDWDDEPSLQERASTFFYFWAAAFLFGAVVLLVAPEATEVIVTNHLPEYGKSLLSGLVAIVAVLGTSVLAALTLVGIPLSAAGLTILIFGAYVAQVFVAVYLGREMLGTPATASEGFIRLALGLFVVYAAKALPWASFLVTLLIIVWGFGAMAAYARDKLGSTAPKAVHGETL